MSPPAVAFVVTGLDLGGAEAQVVALAVAFRARGWRVGVVSLLPPVAHLDPPAPVLGVDDEDPTRTDCDVIDVGEAPSRPAHVVDHRPLGSGQHRQRPSRGYLALGPPLLRAVELDGLRDHGGHDGQDGLVGGAEGHHLRALDGEHDDELPQHHPGHGDAALDHR